MGTENDQFGAPLRYGPDQEELNVIVDIETAKRRAAAQLAISLANLGGDRMLMSRVVEAGGSKDAANFTSVLAPEELGRLDEATFVMENIHDAIKLEAEHRGSRG